MTLLYAEGVSPDLRPPCIQVYRPSGCLAGISPRAPFRHENLPRQTLISPLAPSSALTLVLGPALHPVTSPFSCPGACTCEGSAGLAVPIPLLALWDVGTGRKPGCHWNQPPALQMRNREAYKRGCDLPGVIGQVAEAGVGPRSLSCRGVVPSPFQRLPLSPSAHWLGPLRHILQFFHLQVDIPFPLLWMPPQPQTKPRALAQGSGMPMHLTPAHIHLWEGYLPLHTAYDGLCPSFSLQAMHALSGAF